MDRRCLDQLADLRNKMDNMRIVIDKVYLATCSSIETGGTGTDMPSLPVKSINDLEDLNTFLEEENNKLCMVSKLNDAQGV